MQTSYTGWMHCLKSASTSVFVNVSVGTIIIASRRTNLATTSDTSRDKSERRNRVVVESSPSGCEPPRQIVWKRAVMWSRTKTARQSATEENWSGTMSLPRPSVSIALSDTHQYVHDFSAYQVPFVSSLHSTDAANKEGSWENFVTAQ